MNIQEAKNIRLIDFLSGLGYNPVIQRGNDVWYKSPFRTEKEASFKVDLHKEVWYDFGLGRGGDIITLAKEIYRIQDISHVLRLNGTGRIILPSLSLIFPEGTRYGTGISRLVSLPRTSPVSLARRRAGFAIFLRGLWIFCLSGRLFHLWKRGII